MLTLTLSLCLALLSPPAQSRPDPAAQKAAMQKLAFLVGQWQGESTAITASGPLKLRHSEDVQWRLDGLLLVVEGIGRRADSGAVEFNALATISYDERSQTYRVRAFNGGNFVEAELKAQARGFEWGFTSGPAVVRNVMTLDEAGRWVEYTEVAVNGAPPRRTAELTVTKR